MENESLTFPPLPEEKREALKRDIEIRGVIVPVVIDADTGEVIDGNTRKQIAEELNLKYPVDKRKFSSDEERETTAIALNLLRRHTDDYTWGSFYRALCERKGIKRGGDRTKQTVKLAACEAAELGTTQRTARRRKQLADLLDRPGNEDIRGAVVADQISADRAMKDAKKRLYRDKHMPSDDAPPPPAEGESWEVMEGDATAVLSTMDAGSFDLILTDPPYGEKYLPLYEHLAKEAPRLLTENGSLLVLTGHVLLPKALELFCRHLNYQWIIAYMVPGASAAVWSRNVKVGWKPVVWFVPNKYAGDAVHDVVYSGAPDKEFHDWGQNEQAFAKLVKLFSCVGDRVLDPFCGAGTTGVAALKLGRTFVGIDNDAESVQKSRQRLAECEV